MTALPTIRTLIGPEYLTVTADRHGTATTLRTIRAAVGTEYLVVEDEVTR
ncbi:hypothetical protein H7K24_17925 [Mycobacterium fragae]|jgi:hypothetical protein|nr:hypothetical protein [Mycobacterium fragae]MCV7402023.1 hypothetical protein [Mycobacterium fragae]